MQGNFDRDEQFRPHKDATLHYEVMDGSVQLYGRKHRHMYGPHPPILAIPNVKLGQKVLSAMQINLFS
ncbi:predicted protein [Lichtheimia corymbifera JMRC:FSU:9682]|uniref:Uncharacterized protein n=1 Tax=Lichtheimia corymbifera JMRC:FSU:9682 TaxID=1263082 RepID=A0A068SCW9_9FUNG|nr:predicted protein [Lichtheimia corymbifera JMRC:FSU:9682]